MDVLLQPTEQTRSRQGRAEVVNELLWVAAKRTFTSPGPWPLNCQPPGEVLYCFGCYVSYIIIPKMERVGTAGGGVAWAAWVGSPRWEAEAMSPFHKGRRVGS